MAAFLWYLLLAIVYLKSPATAVMPASMSGHVTATATTNATDNLALMLFKSLIKTDPTRALASWGNWSIPMCQWHGVTCGVRGHRRGRVVELDLSGLSLLGVIAPSIGNLTYLRRLHLQRNHLHGILPSELGSLQELTHLYLSYNSIAGQIPVSLSSCREIKIIWLYSNKLQGQIPSELGLLHNLEVLIIGENRLTGSIPQLQGLLSLTTLVLDTNNLTGSIPTWLGNLSSLTGLVLDRNSLEGKIPESLGNLKMLETLSLTENNLQGAIPHSFGNLYSLKTLYVDSNGLEGPLPPSIFNISSLEVLGLQFNRLNGTFPPDIGNNLPRLQLFSADGNQFYGTIPPSLCNASMIQWIQANDNFLTGTIPDCLGIHQKNLSSVAFEKNQLETRNDFDWGFMSSLTNCSNLVLLNIGANRLRGDLPNSVSNLSTSLRYFVTNYNSITGKIPEGIGNLVNLELVEMNNNLFEGPIPYSFGRLKKLNKLYLSNNKLSGSIPSSLGNLKFLNVLDLYGNALSGEIPPSLSNCPLEDLDLSYNSLSGSIPKELFFISTLSGSLELENNFLTGVLPSDVGNLKNLALIDLSDNMISGDIPTSFGECQSLQYLNTSGNLLQGKIPQSLEQLTGLQVLDLSHNNLSGGIPMFLERMRGLVSLNISFNNLDGDVPKEGNFSNATAISIVGNDGLCNGIPQLKLPPCSNPSIENKKTTSKIAITISLCMVVLFVTLVVALSVFYYRANKAKSNPQITVINEQHLRISYAELLSATNGFASENLIGSGSFGSVYKGIVRSHGQQLLVAVKVLNLTQPGASQSFRAECETLRSIRHRNLVKILTVCSSMDFHGHNFKALVYEFITNGDLDQWLHKHLMETGEQKALDLIGRLHIAIDVASSLDYLHQHKPTPIIHCDLKPSNILLDNNMVAHVGDFGLARFLHQDIEKSSGWASMRGSIGYAAPEYGQGNEVSTYGDVYSYGILLLELFTGKRPTDSEFGEAIGLRKYVEMAFPDRVSTIIDQQLLPEIDYGDASISNSSSIRCMRMACVASILQVGICCSVETPLDRPPIGHALRELEAVRDKLRNHLPSEGAPLNR